MNKNNFLEKIIEVFVSDVVKLLKLKESVCIKLI